MSPRQSRKRKITGAEVSKERSDIRENYETLNFNTMGMETQVLPQNQTIGMPEVSRPDTGALGDLAPAIRELIARFAANAAPGQGGGSPGGQGGGASAPASLNVTAGQRFLQQQQAAAEGPAPGLGRANGLSGGGAAGLIGKLGANFVGDVGQSVGRSGLEVSAGQAAKEHGLDPGKFVESAAGFVSNSGIPIISDLGRAAEGFAHKANADADARSGRTALQMARGRLADIAGGLAARGAHFSDSQLMEARNVLQERAQRELNVRMQIRNLEDGVGAQRSGLGAGGFAR